MEALHANVFDTLVLFAAVAWLVRGLVKAHERRAPSMDAWRERASEDAESAEGEEERADTELLWLPDEGDE